MPEQDRVQELARAVQRYLDLMYDSDLAKFDLVFLPSAQLHGFRDGRMTMTSAAAFKQALAERPSPEALDAPRRDEVLLMDFASDTQAFAKVRVRIHAVTFVDYLSYHRVDGAWLVTAKAYHIERNEPVLSLPQ